MQLQGEKDVKQRVVMISVETVGVVSSAVTAKVEAVLQQVVEVVVVV